MPISKGGHRTEGAQDSSTDQTLEPAQFRTTLLMCFYEPVMTHFIRKADTTFLLVPNFNPFRMQEHIIP